MILSQCVNVRQINESNFHSHSLSLSFISIPPSHLDPLNPFSHVLLLLLLEDKFNEQLLQFLIAVVDAQLLKTVDETDISVCVIDGYFDW